MRVFSGETEEQEERVGQGREQTKKETVKEEVTLAPCVGQSVNIPDATCAGLLLSIMMRMRLWVFWSG